jgi:hypothetical protein
MGFLCEWVGFSKKRFGWVILDVQINKT